MANFIAPESQSLLKHPFKKGYQRFIIARHYLWLAIFLLLAVSAKEIIFAQVQIPLSITLSQSSAAQNVLFNTTGNYLERFVFVNNSDEMILFSTIWFSRDTGSSLAGSLVKNFYLYDNENGLNIAGPQAYSSSVEGIYFQNLAWQINPRSTKSLSLVADIDGSAEDNLKIKFDVDLQRSVINGADSGNPVTITPNPSRVEGVWLTSKAPKAVLNKNNSSPVGLRVVPETKDAVFLIFNLAVNDAENVYLKELKAKIKGATVDDLTAVKIYNSAGTQIASQAVVSGNLDFTFSAVELLAGSDNTFYIKADLNTAANVSLTSKPYLSIDTSADVILQGKTSNGYARVSGFAMGNEVEIMASAPAQKILDLKFEKSLTAADGTSPVTTYIANALAYESGASAQALRSSNSAVYVDYGCGNYFDSNKGTLAVWVKLDAVKGADQYIWTTDNALFSLVYDYESQGTYQKRIKATVGGQELNYIFQTATTSDSWLDSEWKHFALTWASELGKSKLYVNGVLEASLPYVGSKSCTNFRLLNDYAVMSRSFTHGAIDEFKLYNYVLDATQILSDFTGYNYTYIAPTANQGGNNQTTVNPTANTLPGSAAAAAVDSDGDGLSDALEIIFGTDVGKTDTDGDGYTDQEEVNNCYNSNGAGKICDLSLLNRLVGRILLAVEGKGEAFYLSPSDKKAYYLGRASDAYNVMRSLGLGIRNADLQKIPTKDENFTGDLKLRRRLIGRILLQVEGKGEAWYINPVNLKRYYLGRAEDAFQLMRSLGLGITNSNLRKIPLK